MTAHHKPLDPACPSAYALEQYLLSPDTSQANHIEGCARCQAYLQQATEEEAQFSQRTALRQQVLNASYPAKAAQPSFLDWLRGWPVPVWTGGLVAIAVLLFVLWGPLLTTEDPEVTTPALRVKGGLTLAVYSNAKADQGALLAGAEIHPDERLRFTLHLQEDGFVAVLGVDAQGKVFRYHPAQSASHLSPHQSADRDPLDGSVVLDETLGTEWFIALRCDKPLEVSDIEATLRGLASSQADRATWKIKGLPALSLASCTQDAIYLQKRATP